MRALNLIALHDFILMFDDIVVVEPIFYGNLSLDENN